MKPSANLPQSNLALLQTFFVTCRGMHQQENLVEKIPLAAGIFRASTAHFLRIVSFRACISYSRLRRSPIERRSVLS